VDEAGEKELQREERVEKQVSSMLSLRIFVLGACTSHADHACFSVKTARAKANNAAIAPRRSRRQKYDTANPASTSTVKTRTSRKAPQPKDRDRRVSLGPALDAETGDLWDAPRQSTRTATVRRTEETRNRQKTAESRRVCCCFIFVYVRIIKEQVDLTLTLCMLRHLSSRSPGKKSAPKRKTS